MKEGLRPNFPEEVRQARFEAAQEVRAVRKERDVARNEAETGGDPATTAALTEQADQKHAEAKTKLREQQDKVGAVIEKEANFDQHFKDLEAAMRHLKYGIETKDEVSKKAVLESIKYLRENENKVNALLNSGKYIDVDKTIKYQDTLMNDFVDIYNRIDHEWDLKPENKTLSYVAAAELKFAVDEIVRKNSALWQQSITSDESETSIDTMRLLNAHTKTGSFDEGQLAAKIFEKKADVISLSLLGNKNELVSRTGAESLAVLYTGGTKRQEIATDIINEQIRYRLSGIGHLPEIIEKFGDFNDVIAKIKSKELTKLAITDTNTSVDNNELLRAWEEDGKYFGSSAKRNLESMKRIEKERPGAIKYLFEECGIRDFRRYPENLLIKQFDQKDNLDIPYGFIISPIADHNGAFADDSGRYESIDTQLNDSYALRFYEGNSKYDLVRTLINLQRKYNPTNDPAKRIAFAIIGGHGTEQTIQFGAETAKTGARLNSDDLDRQLTIFLSSLFKEDANIILQSCSTGAAEGIGQKLSQKLKRRVIAPNIPTHIKKFTASLSESGVSFEVEFNGDDVGRAYHEGKLESKPKLDEKPI